MAGPRADAVGAQRTRLTRDFSAVIKVGRKLPHPAESNGFEIEVAPRAGFGHHARRQTPQDVWLDHGFGNQFLNTTIKSMQIIARSLFVELSIADVHDSGGEGVHAVS